jgi:hypothetical protein
MRVTSRPDSIDGWHHHVGDDAEELAIGVAGGVVPSVA